MGSLSIWHWLVLAAIVAIFFARPGKLSGIMGDAAKGIKAFKDGLKDDTSQEVADNKANGSLPRTEAEKEDLRKS
ncbi:MAG: twin-arginine translocase TatA/TatE family subunit [Caulobacter sp.]|nr:twin-arginine translocase TatA/TatE family subunit [Caulobacter sp.]